MTFIINIIKANANVNEVGWVLGNMATNNVIVVLHLTLIKNVVNWNT